MSNSRFAFFRASLLCVFLLLPTLICGCSSGSSSSTSTPINNGPLTSATRTYNSLQFTLTTDKTVYKIGDAVHFTLTVKNISAQPLSYSVGFPVADAAVTQQSRDVWQFSLTGGGGDSIGSGVLQPAATNTYTFTWDQTRQSDSAQVSPGQCTLTSWFNPILLNGSPVANTRTNLVSNPIQITVQAQ